MKEFPDPPPRCLAASQVRGNQNYNNSQAEGGDEPGLSACPYAFKDSEGNGEDEDDAEKGERLICNLARRLERDCCGSNLEGIEEILTVIRLRLPEEP